MLPGAIFIEVDGGCAGLYNEESSGKECGKSNGDVGLLQYNIIMGICGDVTPPNENRMEKEAADEMEPICFGSKYTNNTYIGP